MCNDDCICCGIIDGVGAGLYLFVCLRELIHNFQHNILSFIFFGKIIILNFGSPLSLICRLFNLNFFGLVRRQVVQC